MIDGELADPPEGDLETGSSFCGCCSPVQESNSEDVALTFSNEQEAEVEVEAELVGSPEDQEVASIKTVQYDTDELISDEQELDVDYIVEEVIEKLFCEYH